MDRIGPAGWFITDEEYNEIVALLDTLEKMFRKEKTDYEKLNLPYEPRLRPNEPSYPKCPWNNPCDWTWRPEQAPWYGEPIFKDYKVGDGEWWKNSPYCTSTTEDNPNAVKESKTTGDEETEIKVHKTLDEDWCR
jgi:hypothetical protein